MLENELRKVRYDVGYKNTVSYLWGETVGTIFYLRQIQLYKRWREIFNWLVVNKKFGQGLVEFFQNETDRSQGVIVGITYIINKLEGHKMGPMRNLYASDLLEK